MADTTYIRPEVSAAAANARGAATRLAKLANAARIAYGDLAQRSGYQSDESLRGNPVWEGGLEMALTEAMNEMSAAITALGEA